MLGHVVLTAQPDNLQVGVGSGVVGWWASPAPPHFTHGCTVSLPAAMARAVRARTASLRRRSGVLTGGGVACRDLAVHALQADRTDVET
jgi:hypothetical protein